MTDLAGSSKSPECEFFYSVVQDAFAQDWSNDGHVAIANPAWDLVELTIEKAEATKKGLSQERNLLKMWQAN